MGGRGASVSRQAKPKRKLTDGLPKNRGTLSRLRTSRIKATIKKNQLIRHIKTSGRKWKPVPTQAERREARWSRFARFNQNLTPQQLRSQLKFRNR